MSKRCCAQHCFNSTLYTKNVSYFSFPKHKKFADQWADLAGRSDLKQKPLNRVIKYFLCSEHFTANCFHDKDTRQILKRQLPYSIALPSIFKNNLQETLQTSNPNQSIEVHNIVLLQDEDDDNTRTTSLQNEDTQDVICYGFDVESLSRQLSCDSEKTSNDLQQTEEDVLENVSLIDENEFSNSETNQQQNNETEGVLDFTESSTYQCRLCMKELRNGDPMTNFTESFVLKEFIRRIMKDKITLGDEFSQIACKNCENNSLLCLIIIQQMDASQEKFKYPHTEQIAL